MVENKENLEQEQEEEGATMVEYALLLVMISMIIIAALRYLGNSISQEFSAVGSMIARGGGP